VRIFLFSRFVPSDTYSVHISTLCSMDYSRKKSLAGWKRRPFEPRANTSPEVRCTPICSSSTVPPSRGCSSIPRHTSRTPKNATNDLQQMTWTKYKYKFQIRQYETRSDAKYDKMKRTEWMGFSWALSRRQQTRHNGKTIWFLQWAKLVI